MKRTLIIAILIAIWLVVFSGKNHNRKQLIFFCVGSLFAAFIVLWHFKHDSSLGRLQIWKHSWQVLAKQMMWQGIGAGDFNVHYNHAQAGYFVHRVEAMLANDGYYACNKFMHWGIELVWWAGIILLLLFYLFLYQSWRLTKR